ncbi:MAG TPA: response regulator, partial [Pyrinomonadaceae bacterium]|nr:response regulator [Pyrinomonadaceae bacterium]
MKGRVLIIDSDREHCEALSDCMKASDYEVRSLLPGPSVIEIAESFAPTAIVIDPATEGYDPFELLRELRILQPHTPVILTARNSSVELALRAIQEEGAYHYFEKPVDPEKFLTV